MIRCKKVSQRLIILPRRYHSTQRTPVETCQFVTKLGAAANIGLCGLKGVAGAASGSSVMIADAFHSLGDLISDGVTLAAIKYSRTPPTAAYPFGMGKFESLGALAVSGLLVGTSAGIALNSFSALASSTGAAVTILGPATLSVAVASIVVKEVLYQLTLKAGTEARSSVTIANAWHHRSDALSSVVAVIGIAGNMIGYSWFDPVASIVVAGMIGKTGFEIGWDAVHDLSDGSAEDEEVTEIITKICSLNNVKFEPSEVKTRKMGPFQSVILPIHVQSTMSVSSAAALAEKVKTDIMKEAESVQSLYVSVQPRQSNKTSPESGSHPALLRQDIEQILTNVPEIVSVSHFTVHYLAGRLTVQVEVVMDFSVVITTQDAVAVARKAESLIKTIEGVDHADVHLELREVKKSCHDMSSTPISSA
eukprot:TRINITY_DN2004_c0_g1_i1.p1 TRINITY_DN2004_c0_g1~~TRINITY_DN2004_c0_g1_i1.p1  ORF type:complete len:421 (+),score=66.85 TRINITY_DN2004_c0_g1_i1:45-1307(+)